MPTVEARLSYVEGQMSEHVHLFEDIRDSVRHLEHQMDAGFDRIDRRFEAVDQRLDSLDQKLSRHFVWLAGMMMTVLIAVVGALMSRG